MLDFFKNTQEKKKTMARYSEAQKRAVAKYQKKAYDTICLRLPKGYKEKTLQPAAEKSGESVMGFIKKAIAERIEHLDKES